ncbi:lipase family protein [Rhodococcus fascians]|uniref:lipase family protein n=1 Tax=Nocardiaceae TaxID=85025 RepID=UPI0019D253D6|nr:MULTISPECIES: lipase family protein [Rhodococcus]MBW4781367.1 lipase family protein [Rhodococcus fascians]MDJ0003574.1 alpha/beta fold hydrolase [Rhodococcus fascians]
MTNERATSCLRRTAMIVAAALVWGVTLSAPVVADPLSDFYDLPVESTGHSPGDVVRVRPMNSPKGFGLGFDIERILYTSTDTHGEPMTVSGYTMTPTAPWPGPGPRPVIAYAPGTSGMADRCAGSAVLGTVGSSPAILPLLLAGYRVVATDYQGLGTPGGHTYLNRLASGHALLDVARTADDDAPVVLYGYSEGGFASASAAELANGYAPELNIVGAYVGAPPADPTLNIEPLDGTTLGSAILFAVDGMINAYPQRADEIRSVFDADGTALLDAAQNWCSTDRAANDAFDTSELTRDGRPLTAHLNDPGIVDVIDANTVGRIAPSMPVYLSHGVADDVVPIEQSRALLERWQELGADVTYREYDFPVVPITGANHAPGALAAYADILPWIADLVHRSDA